MPTSTPSQLFFLVTLFSVATAFSNLRICTDGNCGRSNRTVDMINDFRNTTCRPLSVIAGGSFQFTELDPGCIVTLYGASISSAMCSSDTHATGKIQTCYNSSWMYYAIEGCRPPSTPSQSPSSVAVSSIPSPSSVNNDRHEDSHRGGFIAGTVVAAISGLALVTTGIMMLMRRRPKVILAGSHELSNDHVLVETVSVEKKVAKELWAGHAAVEMGRNSQFELIGGSVGGSVKIEN